MNIAGLLGAVLASPQASDGEVTIPQLTVSYATTKDVTVDGTLITDTAPNILLHEGSIVQVAGELGLGTVFVDWGNGIYAHVTLRAGTSVQFMDDSGTVGYDVEIMEGSIVIDEFSSSAAMGPSGGGGVGPPNRIRPKKKSIVLGGIGTSYSVSCQGSNMVCAVLTGTVECAFGSQKVVVGPGMAADVPESGWNTPPTPRNATGNEKRIIQSHLSNASSVRLAN